MRNVAVLEDNIVVNIIVCSDDYVLSDNEVEYSESNPAHMGGEYDNGVFYPIQPFPSWVKSNGEWVPPIPFPEINKETNPDNKSLWWDEQNQSWYFA